MEELSEKQETLQADVSQIKDQISQILEALAALKSVKETPVVRNEVLTSSHPLALHLGGQQTQFHAVQGSKVAHAEFLQYGLPQAILLLWEHTPGRSM